MTKIFLSHSSVDKEFARMLFSSFKGMNIDSFLDEVHIKVGDSIPEKIYEALDDSTHLIYIISRASISSKWVKEELSAAKMKDKSSKGFKILPLLIEKVDLPTNIAHVKYADFTMWRDPNLYRRSFLQVLRALDIEPILIKDSDLKWFARNSSTLRKCIYWITINTYELRGGVYADYMHKGAHYLTAKYAVREQGLEQDLKTIIDIIPETISVESRLFALRRASVEVIEYITSTLDICDANSVNSLVHKLVVLHDMLESLRSEYELILLAGVDIEEPALFEYSYTTKYALSDGKWAQAFQTLDLNSTAASIDSEKRNEKRGR